MCENLTMKAKATKLPHVTFALRRETCPAMRLNGKESPKEQPELREKTIVTKVILH